MSTDTQTRPFVFDKNYDNLDQVAHLWDAYEARYNELVEAGRYPYNDDFKGHIPGAEGPNEDTAIYLLQSTRHVRDYHARVQSLRDQGYTEPVDTSEGTRKFASVAHVTMCYGNYGQVHVHDNARVIFSGGAASAILPKGARTRGYRVSGAEYVLVKH